MGRYPEADVGRVRGHSVRRRTTRVGTASCARPPADPESFAEFWDGLPPMLAAADLRALARAIVSARRAGRPVVWMFGAHVIKVGLTPLLIRLLREDFATLLAVNGAFAIHDSEMALWGATSEDVAAELERGRFGMARETAALLNGAALEAAKRGEGFGEAIGRRLEAMRARWRGESVLGEAYARGIPACVHVAIGTDIVHQHPDFSGSATGEASARDFRILAGHFADLRGAVVLNVGSAVVLPEVFLKALSVAVHLGARTRGLTTAVLDFHRHYRPLTNVAARPACLGAQGLSITGHHEVLLPLLFQGLLLERGRAAARRSGARRPSGKRAARG